MTKKAQSMKAATAAKKLGIYLPAAPQEFQDRAVTRDELDRVQQDPPQWLTDLRRNGPHPRPVVAARLGVSISGLARNGLTEPLTTEQIAQIREDAPEWLARERAIAAEVRAEEERLKAEQAKAARAQRS
ncbi:MAG: DUF5997 family protein [Cellulomonadaceae bacterium]